MTLKVFAESMFFKNWSVTKSNSQLLLLSTARSIDESFIYISNSHLFISTRQSWNFDTKKKYSEWEIEMDPEHLNIASTNCANWKLSIHKNMRIDIIPSCVPSGLILMFVRKNKCNFGLLNDEVTKIINQNVFFQIVFQVWKRDFVN